MSIVTKGVWLSCVCAVAALGSVDLSYAQTLVGKSQQQKMIEQAMAKRDQQRLLYQQAQHLLDEAKLEEYALISDQLADYPLLPYLQYRIFLIDLADKSPKQVHDFISENKQYPFSSSIHSSYLDALIEQKSWTRLLSYQTTEPHDQEYRCHYYSAKLATGDKKGAFAGARQLWLTGQSVSSACDGLFDAWQQQGLMDEQAILDRMVLALDARNSNMLNYLVRLLHTENSHQIGESIKELLSEPDSVVHYSKITPVSEFSQHLAYLGFKELVRQDTKAAVQALAKVVKTQQLSKQTEQELAEYAAAWLINTDSEQLAQWRDEILLLSQDESLIERRVRLAIQQANWQGVGQWITRLPDSTQQSMRWQYWLARVEFFQGQNVQAQQRLEKLLGERNFYSVAAANLLGKPIRYQSRMVDEAKLADLSEYHQALTRISELLALDKIAAAKSEWRWLLSSSDEQYQRALAKYAGEHHWYHLAVVATIEANMWDYTSLRFPIAYQHWFKFYAQKHNIEPITLLSLARQESALDSEAYSPVGARGIMQIMPTTAQHTAKVYGLEYKDASQLFNVEKNIEIGSQYLSGLLSDFDNNRIFAFAAYNAGPNRVKRWRERSNESIDAYSFIEAIPFNETRGYVQNILMFETYYRNLVGQDGPFLTPDEINMKY